MGAEDAVIVALLALLAALVIYILIKNSDRDGFANGAPAGDWRLLYAPWCGFCKKQMALVGDWCRERPGRCVDCTRPENSAICTKANGYPTWLNEKTGAVLPGYRDAAALRAMVEGNL
jgi:thiol-disulfide isomerase/thioredoxin